ncbi:MAG: MnhB domain-containing protein [Opitutales bacterium]
MTSLIFTTLTRKLLPLLLVLSLIVLYRGHNLPGGGFVGGLMAATGFILVALAEGRAKAARILRFHPETFLAVGLAFAAGSALIAVLGFGEGFMTGQWLHEFHLPLLGKVHLGTPVLFDIGVYFVVIGFSLLTTFSLQDATPE